MNCPKCQSDNNRVVSSRPEYGGRVIKRRRQCQQSGCLHRWSTRETDDELLGLALDYALSHRRLEKWLNATCGD